MLICVHVFTVFAAAAWLTTIVTHTWEFSTLPSGVAFHAIIGIFSSATMLATAVAEKRTGKVLAQVVVKWVFRIAVLLVVLAFAWGTVHGAPHLTAIPPTI
jgi:hypothetical protein